MKKTTKSYVFETEMKKFTYERDTFDEYFESTELEKVLELWEFFSEEGIKVGLKQQKELFPLMKAGKISIDELKEFYKSCENPDVFLAATKLPVEKIFEYGGNLNYCYELAKNERFANIRKHKLLQKFETGLVFRAGNNVVVAPLGLLDGLKPDNLSDEEWFDFWETYTSIKDIKEKQKQVVAYMLKSYSPDEVLKLVNAKVDDILAKVHLLDYFLENGASVEALLKIKNIRNVEIEFIRVLSETYSLNVDNAINLFLATKHEVIYELLQYENLNFAKNQFMFLIKRRELKDEELEELINNPKFSNVFEQEER